MMATRRKKITSPPVVPAGVQETRRQRFERIATPRMNRVLNSIRLLGNLASPNYEWAENDIETMQSTIVGVLGETLARFHKRKRGDKITFEFKKVEEPTF